MGTWLPGVVVNKKQWSEELFSLQIDAAIPEFNAGQFVRIALDINDERIARPYSCVNSPDEKYIEVYFNIIPDGPLTPKLARLEIGDSIWVWDSVNGLLTLNEVPECRHLWMCATGTGIGPYISIMKTDKVWNRFEKVILVYATRTFAEMAYQDFINSVSSDHGGQFIYCPILSREEKQSMLPGRIPALIDTGKLEAQAGLEIDAQNSHVMLCGNSGMIADTITVLGKRGMQKHKRREPGHIAMEKYH